MHAPKPFRPALIAKIKQFDLRLGCARAPDGRTFVRSMSADIEGRAMMKSFRQSERREISNLRLP